MLLPPLMGIDFLMRIIAFQEGKGKGFEGGGQPSDKIHPADVEYGKMN